MTSRNVITYRMVTLNIISVWMNLDLEWKKKKMLGILFEWKKKQTIFPVLESSELASSDETNALPSDKH